MAGEERLFINSIRLGLEWRSSGDRSSRRRCKMRALSTGRLRSRHFMQQDGCAAEKQHPL